MATGGINLSKEFFELLKAIGESKSKQEEDRIIAREVATLKQKLERPSSSMSGPGSGNPLLTSKRRAKEFLVRLLYVEMLGHDASFGYIKAVEMAASSSLSHKRTGYLVCAACLSPDHEFRFMLVNQMQRDMQSSSVLEMSGGLLAATALLTGDMVPALSGEVIKLLSHESETIRKKAILCLHRFHQLAPDTVTRDDLLDRLRKVLCDRDPAVMGASLNVIESLAVTDTTAFKDLVPSLVSILKQIGDHRLPSDYDYHRVPAPWMQIRLVRILSLIGQADAAASSGMYEILNDTMKKADVGINAGYAIVYECIKCITKIYPNTKLLDAAADAISRFIQSRSHNLKYLGVTGLAMIVETHPHYAAQHQLAVLDCLEDPDETLQRKTLDLLYRMTNPVNVEFITDKLLVFCTGTTDLFLKQQLTRRICSVAERYAPNNGWYLRTITQLLQTSGDLVDDKVAQNLMTLIAEGTGESEEADMLLRQTAVELYIGLLNNKGTDETIAGADPNRPKSAATLPKILLETMAWVLGEYAYLSVESSLEGVLSKLCKLVSENKARLAPSTRKYIVTALVKLVAQAGKCPPEAAAVLDDYTRSKDVDLQQRCLEWQALLTSAPEYLGVILPVDASAEELDVDVNLSFLDGFVSEALSNGARPYEKPYDDDDDDDDEDYDGGAASSKPAFNLTPYEKPKAPSSMYAMRNNINNNAGGYANSTSLPPGAIPSGGGAIPGPSLNPGTLPDGGLSLNTRHVANVWGKGGLGKGAASQPAPAPAAPAPAASAFDSNPYAAQRPGGAFGNSAPASNLYGHPTAPAPAPEKTAAQLEKERMAAALFGGIAPGSVAAAPPPAPRVAAPAPTPSAPAPAPPPAPAPEPEIDLLDMGAFDVTPAPAPISGVIDIFGSAPLPQAPPAPTPAPAVVETVSEDEEGIAPAVSAAPASLPAEPIDPFAAEGLLGDLTDQPLTSFGGVVKKKFEFNGTPLVALPIDTAQFGQQWGACPATTPLTIASSSKIDSLTKFMSECDTTVGLHPVEAISATNEGICAGRIGDNFLVLVHGKISPTGTGSSRVDVTIKSNDQTLTGSLALYFQNMMS